MKPIYSNMLWLPKKGSTANFDKLRQELTVHSKYPDVQPIETFQETEDWIGIPRNYCQIPDNAALECRTGKNLPFEAYINLRQNQKYVINKWHKLYKAGTTDWIFNVPTGFGKSLLALYVACQLKLPFLIIVPREDLMGQWATFITQFTNIPNGKIGYVRQSRCEYDGKSASIGLIHSLAKDYYPQEFKDYFGLVIADELHTLGATTFSEVAKQFPAKYRLGLSATLSRADGMQDCYYFHFGKNVIQAQKSFQPKPKVALYKFKGKSSKMPPWCKDAIQKRAFAISNLAVNTERNKLIVHFIKKLTEKGIRTLVTSERIYQLEQIKALLDFEKEGPTKGIYISQTKKEVRQKLLKDAQCILATTKMIDVGIDESTLRGLILATPVSDVRQMAGRIRRINDSMPDPVIVDIVDYCYKNTQYWAKKRFDWYAKEGFEVTEIS